MMFSLVVPDWTVRSGNKKLNPSPSLWGRSVNGNTPVLHAGTAGSNPADSTVAVVLVASTQGCGP